MSALSARSSWQIDPGEVSAIESFLLRRLREHAAGDHISIHAGSGFEVRGLREWEPGDAMSAIDWAQSSINNFSPLIIRQLEQDSAATIMVAADASLSTHCGPPGAPLRATIQRCLAVLGLSAAFSQDRFGLVAFDDRGRPLATLRPRAGKAHALHALSLYARCSDDGVPGSGELVVEIDSYLRSSSLVVLVSDCLLADIDDLLARFATLGGEHDVLVVMVDARVVYALPPVSAGWLEICDVETGESRTVSRAAAADMRQRVEEWQAAVMRKAQAEGLDIVRVSAGRWELEEALSTCFARRRLQKLRG
jgi:uncharacterized protein (DUF58 family)